MKTRILNAVRFALNEIGKDSSEEAAQKIIAKFERGRTVYLIDELVEDIKMRAEAFDERLATLGIPVDDWEAYEEEVVGL